MAYTELQETIQKLLLEGFLKGFKEGVHTRNLEIASKMLQKDFHIKFIKEMTGIGDEDHVEDFLQGL
jgi:predicted transposase YdaD